jgi:hypothetical protein
MHHTPQDSKDYSILSYFTKCIIFWTKSGHFVYIIGSCFCNDLAMTLDERPMHAQRRQRIKMLRDMFIGGIAIPIGLVGFAGIIAYVLYLLF